LLAFLGLNSGQQQRRHARCSKLRRAGIRHAEAHRKCYIHVCVGASTSPGTAVATCARRYGVSREAVGTCTRCFRSRPSWLVPFFHLCPPAARPEAPQEQERRAARGRVQRVADRRLAGGAQAAGDPDATQQRASACPVCLLACLLACRACLLACLLACRLLASMFACSAAGCTQA
jgi:hypothetical protein